MPTWGIHFRIADALICDLRHTDVDYFIIGNIAPDCGVQTAAHGIYDPPTGVTHFTSGMAYSNKTDCDYNHVYRTYVAGETDIRKRSFYLGYYVHLLTDCIFANEVFVPIEAAYGAFRENEMLSRTVKAEKNNIDFQYFAAHRSPSFARFCALPPFDEAYPSWYQKGAIAEKMRFIVSYYRTNQPQDMPYQYLTPEGMTDFITCVLIRIRRDLEEKSAGFLKK